MNTAAPSEFRAAMLAAGLTPPETLITDGKLHRCPSKDSARDDAGWYVFHDDGIPAGAFGDWRTGLRETWHAKMARRLTLSERAALQASMRDKQADAARQQERDHAIGARKAAALWARSTPAGAHPYLLAKGIPESGARLYRSALVIPLSDTDGHLWNLQFIAADGSKRFLKGARVNGCLYRIQGANDDTILICEGFATAASLHRATGHTCVMSLTAGNMAAVARAIRTKHPAARLVVIADNDAATEAKRGINPGINAATAAARAVRGLLCVPSFTAPGVSA